MLHMSLYLELQTFECAEEKVHNEVKGPAIEINVVGSKGRDKKF